MGNANLSGGVMGGNPTLSTGPLSGIYWMWTFAIIVFLLHKKLLQKCLLGPSSRQMGNISAPGQGYGRESGSQQSGREKASDMVIITNVSR